MAGSSGSMSLADALSISSEARIVTTATAPYTIVHTNKAWSEATGFKFTEVAGKTCKLLQGLATDKGALAMLHTDLAEKRPSKTEVINYTKSGDPIKVTIDCAPVTGNSHFFATIKATPITDGTVVPRKRPACEELSNEVWLDEPVSYAERHRGKRAKRVVEHALISDVLSNNSEPIVMCAKEYPHVITHANQRWLEMCGYAFEEVEGLTNKILTGPDTDPNVIRDLLTCVNRCEPTTQTLYNYKKGGVRFLNQVTVQPVYDDNDEVAAFMSMLREIEEGV